MAWRFAAVLCVLGLPLAARAQTGTGTAGSGMCTGMMTGTIGLAVPDGPQQLSDHPVEPDHHRRLRHGRVRVRLGAQQSQHQPRDQADEPRSPPPPPAPPRSGSATRAARTCRRARRARTPPARRSPRRRSRTSPSTAPAPPPAACTTRSTPRRCRTPIRRIRRCTPAIRRRPASTPANSIYVFVFQDPNSPQATLPADAERAAAGARPPSPARPLPAATAPSRSTGRRSAAGTYAPRFYQILCTDDCGNPIKSSTNLADLLDLRQRHAVRAAT